MDFDKFYVLAEPYLKEAVTKDYDLKKIATLVKTRIEILPEIKEQVDFFEELPDYDIALYTHKKMKTDPEKSTRTSERGSSGSRGAGGLLVMMHCLRH